MNKTTTNLTLSIIYSFHVQLGRFTSLLPLLWWDVSTGSQVHYAEVLEKWMVPYSETPGARPVHPNIHRQQQNSPATLGSITLQGLRLLFWILIPGAKQTEYLRQQTGGCFRIYIYILCAALLLQKLALHPLCSRRNITDSIVMSERQFPSKTWFWHPLTFSKNASFLP